MGSFTGYKLWPLQPRASTTALRNSETEEADWGSQTTNFFLHPAGLLNFESIAYNSRLKRRVAKFSHQADLELIEHPSLSHDDLLPQLAKNRDYRSKKTCFKLPQDEAALFNVLCEIKEKQAPSLMEGSSKVRIQTLNKVA
ncbi:hypothetical protein STEG23_006631 [Scotinomys teguina]